MSTTMKKDQGNQGNQGQQTAQAKDQANQAMDKGREAASHAGEAVSHAASAVGQAVAQKASDVGHTIGQKAEDATAAAGSGMQSLADKVRDNAPQQGTLGSASRTVANALDTAGHYVEDKNLSGMMDDMTGLIRRNPVPAVLLGLGIGFLIGRVLSSSRS